jgi:Putative adhesin
MTSRTILVAASMLLLAASSFASSQTVNAGDNVRACGDLHVTFDNHDAVRAEESLTIPGSIALNINPGNNGGVYLSGYDGSQYDVKVCKLAETQADLANLRAQHAGESLTVTGTDRDHTLVYFIVRAPRSASVSVSTHNGPVSATDLDGSIQLRTENGPISIRKTSGEVQATAVNGPISFTGDGGKVTLHATNGPIRLALNGTRWNGSGVEASTENGPVSLFVARDYASGVVVSSDGHSPFRCEADLCRGTSFEDGRRVELGAGAPVVNVSTHNGPVSIKTARGEVL